MGARSANLWWSQRSLLFTPYHRLCSKLNSSLSFSSPKASHCLDDDCGDFLPWLRQKAGTEISSFLSIGKSTYGRCLFASKFIRTGDSILKVPYSVQLAPDNLLPQINSLLGNEVGDIAKLAIVILVEQKLAQDSEWAPYISRLPHIGDMNSTIFWSDDDLEMIRESSLYQETIKQKAQIEKDFLAIKHALQQFPEFFEDVTLKEFKHAYGLEIYSCFDDILYMFQFLLEHGQVRGIPFADFLNHDGISETDVLCDESKQISEVVADRDYTPGDQVLIRYGKFSNGTLLLDFGFALSSNIYDQLSERFLYKLALGVGKSKMRSLRINYGSLARTYHGFVARFSHEVQIEVDIPHHDPLHAMKMDLLRRHFTPAIEDVNGFSSCGNSFIIKEVKSASRNGRGIPQSLRAFARVLCSTSPQELSDLAKEAAQTDGRLARHPLKNRTIELQAHEFLLSKISRLIEGYSAAIKPLGAPSYPRMHDKVAQRRQLAQDLLNGELRVLKSAAAWLKNYCKTL